MASKRNAEKAALWRDVLDRQASSRLSIRGFCESEGISEPSFYFWRRRLNRPSRSATKAPAGRPSGKDAGSQFIPLSLLDSPATMELVHPLGYRIRLNGDVDPSMLANVLDAIDRRASQ